MLSYHQETTMLREIQEPDRETIPESEILTEPRLRAISLTSPAADRRCVTVQDSFTFHSVPTVGPTQQARNQQVDSCFLQSCGSKVVSGKMYTTSSTDVLL